MRMEEYKYANIIVYTECFQKSTFYVGIKIFNSLTRSLTILNLESTRDLNPKLAADGWGTFHFKCLFLYLLILYAVLHTFLKLIS